MSAYPLQTISTSAVALAIAIGAGAAQAQGSSVGVQPQVYPQRQAPAAAPVMTQPMSPWGPNTAQTIVRPVVDPVPFSPAFPASPSQPTYVRPPVVINNTVIINAPPSDTEFPGGAMAGPQLPVISPSAPMLVDPSAQMIQPAPLTGQTVIIQPLGN